MERGILVARAGRGCPTITQALRPGKGHRRIPGMLGLELIHLVVYIAVELH